MSSHQVEPVGLPIDGRLLQEVHRPRIIGVEFDIEVHAVVMGPVQHDAEQDLAEAAILDVDRIQKSGSRK